MELQSRIDAVTVYAQGAVVRRLASAPAPPDGLPRVVRVAGLPLALTPASLRASVVAGPAELRVLDVRSDLVSRATEPVDVPAEQRALDVAEETLSRLGVEQEAVERDVADLQALRPLWPVARKGEPPRPARPEAALALADFVSSQLEERLRRRAELLLLIQDARNEVELHGRRLAEAGKKRAGELQLSRLAVVTLSAAGGAGSLSLAVEYLVPGARWSPAYELRLDRGLSRGTLLLRAAVAQATGEDWTSVKLSLSTADLDRRTELPELKSLRIGRAQPAPPRSGWREAPAGLDELFAGYEAVRRAQPVAVAAAAPARGVDTGRHRRSAAATLAAPDELDLSLEEAEGAPMMLSAPAAAPPKASMPPPRAVQPARPMASMAPGRSMRAPTVRASAAPPTAEMGGGEPEEDLEPEAASGPPAIGIDPGLLEYDRLVMGPPDEPARRGRLRRASERELLITTALHLHVDVQVVTTLLVSSDRTARDVSRLSLPDGAVPLRQSAGSFDHRYDCADRVDVTANGAWQVVPVLSADVLVAAEYTTVPSVEPHVYRVLRVENRSAHALLGGPVGVLVGDDYLLTSSLPPLSAGQHATLGLGVAEAIQVARNTSFKETTGGLLGGQSLLQHEVKVEVRNGLGVPARVEVRERLPVSDEDAIKVEETQVRPPWENDEAPRDGVATRGARVWKVTLPPGEKAEFLAQYTIRLPGDKMLSGGNRRVG